MTDRDSTIHEQISRLVELEHELRERLTGERDEGTRGEERLELQRLERQLDVCWDLLRQRDARRDAGQDPDGAAPRPTGEVEGYLQ